MSALDTNYQKLPEDTDSLNDGYTVHVASEGAKARWNHVKNLDCFFRDIYEFHQKKGLTCIITDEVLKMLLFAMAIFGFVYIVHCVNFDYTYAFWNINGTIPIQKDDLFMPLSVCSANWGFLTWLVLLIGIVCVIYQFVQVIRTYYEFKNIEMFFESAMKIPKEEIHNITWHEVQCRLREVQHEQQICVHKSDLTELDIYHRILRYKNYMVALVNKNVLPLKHQTPFGEWVYFPSTLEYSVRLLLFESPISPFEKSGHLKEEYKKYSKRKEAAAELSRNILLIGLGALLLSPLIFSWRVLSYILNYSGIARFEPGVFFTRKWSNYAKLYLRHFNELDHEMNARLSRAYNASQDYLKAFPSPTLVIVAQFTSIIASFIACFFGVWGLYNQKVLLHNYILVTVFVSYGFYQAFQKLIPKEYEIYFPELLMKNIIAEIHYVPDHFKQASHTTRVKDEFCQLYQCMLTNLLEELLSPILTPLVLIFHLRPRALDLVDFQRNFTVEVGGVGDVCSFSLMKVSKHGNHEWEIPQLSKADHNEQAEDGKTELSLIHFALLNPRWDAPASSKAFMDDFKEQVNNRKEKCPEFLENPVYNSMRSVDTIGSRYPSLGASMMQQSLLPAESMTTGVYRQRPGEMRGLNGVEGPSYLEPDLSSVVPLGANPIQVRNHHMSVSAILLHEMHDEKMSSAGPSHQSTPSISHPQHQEGNEQLPLFTENRNYVQ